jgi:transposase
MELIRYGNLMKLVGKAKYFTIRKSIVQEALKNGIKPTARKFGMSKNTVKLWLKRFQYEGNDGLLDQRSGPLHIPHKTSQEMEEAVLRVRKTAPCYGARRMKSFFDLSPSIGAIQRILKDHGLTKKKKKKYQKKNDLRAMKAKYKSFERLQMDIKYLTDIPPYWEMMQRLNLPRFQYTIRDVKSGMLFLGYADEISIEKSTYMLSYVLGKITHEFPGKVVVQTDNGVEFSGTTRYYERNMFSQTVHKYGAEHRYIPPGMCNANADVESLHDTIEEEFYNLTQFVSRKDFLRKAESYRCFYNLQRPNFSKGAKTPWLIAQQDHSTSDFGSRVQFTEVIDLEAVFNRAFLGGQTFPVLSVYFCLFSKTSFAFHCKRG